MATNKKTSEEDYLDNLLKSVINEKSDGIDMSDDDIMGDIEKELFDEGDDDIDELVEEENIGELNLDLELEESGLNKKKERRHFFGKRKNKDKDKDNVNTSDTETVSKDNESDIAEDLEKDTEIEPFVEYDSKDSEMMEMPTERDDTEAATVEKKEDSLDNTESENVSDIPDLFGEIGDLFSESGEISMENEKAPEGFEGIFEDESHNSDIMDIANSLGSAADIENLDEIISELEEADGDGKRKKRKKKKEKKKGLFGLFGKKEKNSEKEDDDKQESQIEEIPEDELGMDGLSELGDFFADDVAMSSESDAIDMADIENLQDLDEEPPKENKKKEKKKKEKKKKEKKKKEKKPKEKKVREKKPKKPKEPDVVIPIPFPFVLFSISLIVLLVVFLKLSGDATHYTEKTGNAVSYYLDGKYEEAYNEISGMEMKSKDDKYFYNKLQTIMYVERHYISYKNLYKLEKYDQALFSLLRGVKMYDKHIENAKEYECESEFKAVYKKIKKELDDKYNISEKKARELNEIKYIGEFSQQIYELADKVVVVEEKDEKEKEDKDKPSDGKNKK